MAWLESHQSLGEHPKTKKLCRILDISKREAVGTLHLLWWWALDYAEDGDLSRYDNLDIAIGADWDQSETEFVNALVSSGFLDRNGDRLLIHDWRDYAGKLIERREKNAQRMRDARANHEQSTNNERATHVQGTMHARAELQNQTKPTQPDQTEPTPPQPPKGERVRVLKTPDMSGFDEFWSLFPRHIGRDPAEKAWAKLKPDERLAAIAAIREQITWPSFTSVAPEKIPHPTTWLNQGRWKDEPDKPTNVQPIRPPTRPQLPPVMQPGHVPKDGGLAEWRNAGTSGA